MLKILSTLILLLTVKDSPWVKCKVDEKVFVSFPLAPKKEYLYGDILMSASTSNCDFNITVHNTPKEVFPKTSKDKLALLQSAVERSKHDGSFISSNTFTIGKTIGMEIKSYFNPGISLRFVQVERSFFLNGWKYNLSSVYKNKNEKICDKESEQFFSSLRIID